MGNCFVNCFQNKESLFATASNESVSITSSDGSACGLSTDKSSKKVKVPRVKKVVKNKRSSVVAPKVWNRSGNRVAPCDNAGAWESSSEKTLQGSSHFLYPVSNSSENSLKSTSSNSSNLQTESQASSYDHYSSQSSYSESREYDDSRLLSRNNIESGVTKGRPLLVEPCNSFSESCESSSENIHSSYAIKRAASSFDSSSFGSCAETLVQFDDFSEEESCKIYPCIL